MRVTQHNADIVAAALDALQLFAVKRGAHLSGEVDLRQAKRLGLRLDRQLNLLFALAERVGDINDPLKLGQLALEPLGSVLKFVEIGPVQDNIDGIAGLKNVGGELQVFGLRHFADFFAPAACQLVGGKLSFLGGGGLDVYLACVSAYDGGGHAAAGAALIRHERLTTYRSEHVADDTRIMFFAFGIEFVTHLDGSLFKLLHGPLSFFHSRAKRHSDGGGHVIALDRWEKREPDMPTADEPHRDHE